MALPIIFNPMQVQIYLVFKALT